MAHAQASQPMNDDLISRNRALLTQASAIRAYAALLREETAEAVLTALTVGPQWPVRLVAAHPVENARPLTRFRLPEQTRGWIPGRILAIEHPAIVRGIRQ